MNFWPYTLKTQRLTLRPWTEDDAPYLFELAKSENVGPSAGWPAHKDEEESLFIINNVLSHPYTFAICLTDSSSTPIGCCSLNVGGSSQLTKDESEAELGYWIGEKYWGRNFAPEASAELLRFGFEDLKLSKIWCSHNTDNPKSAKVKQKLGFSYSYEIKNNKRNLMGDTKDQIVSVLDKTSWLKSDRLDSSMIGMQQNEACLLMENPIYIKRICSGGQTGADRGGLDAAIAHNVEICGWCPKDGLAEDFTCAPGIKALYPELHEEESLSYVLRTAHNVEDSHATLIVAPLGLIPKSGTEMTAQFAKRFKRPYKVISGMKEIDETVSWIKSIGCGLTLNIAGPRESKSTGVYQETYKVVSALLDKLS